jgi:hypothetical protein
MKSIKLATLLFFLGICSSIAGNLTSNQTNLGCGVDTVLLNFEADSSFTISNPTYYWSIGYQDLSNGFGTIYENSTTNTPNLTLITNGNLLFVNVGVSDQFGFLDYGYLSFTNNIPQLFLLSAPSVTCGNTCNLTYTVGITNNETGGTMSVGANSYTIAPFQASIALDNLCAGSEVVFTPANTLCDPQTLTLPQSQVFYGMYQVSSLDPIGGCNGVYQFNYQSCETIDSVSLFSYGTNGIIAYNTDYQISYDGNLQGVLTLNNLCLGSYYFNVYQNGQIVYNNFIDLYNNGYYIALFNNLEQNNDVNYNCTGSGSVDITTNYAPFELIVYNSNNGANDTLIIDTTFYQVNLNNLCQGNYYVSVRLLNSNQNTNYATISILNEIEIDLTTSILNASNCSTNDGSITLNYTSLPEPLTVFASNQNGGMNYLDPIVLPASGPYTITGFKEGLNTIQITNNNYFQYLYQSFNVGIDTNNFVNNYTSSITQHPGCESCIGRVLIDFNDNYNSGVVAFTGGSYSFVESGENIEVINICSNVNEIVLYSHYSSVLCVDTINVSFNNLNSDSINSPSISMISPAACNTPLSLDGSINMTDNTVRNYSWFNYDVSFLPISDSLDLFNVSSGNYKLISYNNSSCNILDVYVPFNDTCTMFTSYAVKDYNNNCMYDEWNNYLNREVVVNPGGYIVNSNGIINLPLGNYTATPLQNPELYCTDSVNFTSENNPWNNYSYVIFSDSSSYNDVELAMFPGYGYENFGVYFGGYVTNNSDDTVNVLLKVIAPEILNTIYINSWNTINYETNLFYYMSNDTIVVPLTIPASSQLYIDINSTLTDDVQAGNYALSYVLDYNDINQTNNISNTFISIIELFAGRNTQTSPVIVTKEVSNNGLITDINEDMIFTFTIANNGNETINKFFIKEQLSEYLNSSSIKFINAQNTHYLLQNDGSIIVKMMDANIAPGSVKQIQYKIRPNNNTPNGTLIFSDAIFAYNHYSYKNITAADITVSLKDINGGAFNNSELQIWPNPAQNTIQMNVVEAGGTLKISDLLGKTIISRQLLSNGIISQSISELENGMYLVEVSYSNKRMVTKLIKK